MQEALQQGLLGSLPVYEKCVLYAVMGLAAYAIIKLEVPALYWRIHDWFNNR